MRESIDRYGQISPVTVGRALDDTKRYELIDGFKRYRACRDLGRTTMSIQELKGGTHALKAAMVNLNRSQGTLHAFEEALVAQSLYRDDCLDQQQIAVLLGRHKSWVCRRIALCERLCEEAIGHIRLGLIGFATARELWRLPRGNQSAALACVARHRLDSRETAFLVSRLLQSPSWEHESILRLPIDILDRRRPPRPSAVAAATVSAYEQVCAALEAVRAGIDEATGRIERFDGTQRKTVLEKAVAATQRLAEFQAALEAGLSHVY